MDRRGRKNTSGGWLRGVLIQRMVAAISVTMATTGFSIGFLVRGMPPVEHVVRQFPSWTVLACLALLVVAVFAAVLRYMQRTEATWGVGLAAERRVGDRIEHALARPDCAYAHNVIEALGGAGDVDHVAMTPVGLWVVETKSAWLRGKLFQKALEQAAGNAERVRRHLATRIPVRAALVIADESGQSFESEFDWKGEPVTAFRVVSFWKRLREECDQGETGDDEERARVSRLVWNLGSSKHLSP